MNLFDLLSELGVGQQLLHHGSLPVLLGNTGMIKVRWVVHHRPNLPTHKNHHAGYSHINSLMLYFKSITPLCICLRESLEKRRIY